MWLRGFAEGDVAQRELPDAGCHASRNEPVGRGALRRGPRHLHFPDVHKAGTPYESRRVAVRARAAV